MVRVRSITVNRSSFNPWRGVGGMPADVWIIFATALINRTGTIVLPFLVLYLTQHLGYATGIAGFSLTVYGLGGLVSAPIAGWFTDRMGGLRTMQLSLFMAGALLLILPLAREVSAVFMLIFFPVSAAYVGDLAPADRRGAYIGAYWMVFGLAMMLGPWAGTLFMEHFGASALWILVSACGACAAVILWLVADPRAVPASHEDADALT
jgi:MFS family permease